MRAVVVYESMYGNTHVVAEAIGRGLGSAGSVVVVPVHQATSDLFEGADLVVVGGPTHAHGMSRRNTRKAALDAAQRPNSKVELDRYSQGPGVRGWFASLGQVKAKAAAFDTRFGGPGVLTGRASKGIARGLRRHGFDVIAKPASFFIDNENRLRPGEEDRALAWAQGLASKAGLEGRPMGAPGAELR